MLTDTLYKYANWTIWTSWVFFVLHLDSLHGFLHDPYVSTNRCTNLSFFFFFLPFSPCSISEDTTVLPQRVHPELSNQQITLLVFRHSQVLCVADWLTLFFFFLFVLLFCEKHCTLLVGLIEFNLPHNDCSGTKWLLSTISRSQRHYRLWHSFTFRALLHRLCTFSLFPLPSVFFYLFFLRCDDRKHQSSVVLAVVRNQWIQW